MGRDRPRNGWNGRPKQPRSSAWSGRPGPSAPPPPPRPPTPAAGGHAPLGVTDQPLNPPPVAPPPVSPNRGSPNRVSPNRVSPPAVAPPPVSSTAPTTVLNAQRRQAPPPPAPPPPPQPAYAPPPPPPAAAYSRPPAARPARPPRPPRPPRNRGGLLKKVALLLVVAMIGFGIYVDTQITRVSALKGGSSFSTDGTNWLIVGSDSRADLSEQQEQQLTTGNAAGERTDTIMLLHSGSSGAVLVSLPRDSLLAIPGHGRNKLNASFSFGGPQLLVRTVENATGLRIDHYAEIGF